MTRNPSIYTGKVGAKMKAPSHRVGSRRISRRNVLCAGGPYSGNVIRLEAANGTGTTLPFSVGKHAGHYASGKWVAAAVTERVAA